MSDEAICIVCIKLHNSCKLHNGIIHTICIIYIMRIICIIYIMHINPLNPTHIYIMQ